jgi:signal peptide peptidase SppA
MPNELPELANLEAAAFADARGISSRVPRLEQYFGTWAILADHFRASVNRFNQINLNLHIEQHTAEPQARSSDESGSSRRYQLSKGGVAVIDIAGSMMKGESSLGESASTIAVRRAVRQAAADDECSAILLRIDSPGGTVSGTGDLADDVAAASNKKPVYAYCEDLCCSAAYWVASQCDKVFANATALVGSIGTYGVIEDSSGAAEQQGIKVHVVKAGAFKGAGVEGTAVTDDQLAMIQERIDKTNEHFVRGVAKGRKLSLATTRELADGRAHIAADAVKNGLIDGVQSFDDTLAQLSSKSRPKSSSTSTGSKSMSSEAGGAPVAATYPQLKAACTGADASFLVAQLEAGATVDVARANWAAEQNRQLAAVKAENEQLKAQAAKPGVVAGVKSGGRKTGAAAAAAEVEAAAATGDAIEAWHSAVDAKHKHFDKMRMHTRLTGRKRNALAVAEVVKEKPELHAAYIEAKAAEFRQNKFRRAMEAAGLGNAQERGF